MEYFEVFSLTEAFKVIPKLGGKTLPVSSRFTSLSNLNEVLQETHQVMTFDEHPYLVFAYDVDLEKRVAVLKLRELNDVTD